MAVANHEGSLLSFPGASGWFTHSLGVPGGGLNDGTAVGSVAGSLASVLNYGTPFPNSSGVIGNLQGSASVHVINSGLILAQAIQNVTVGVNVVSEPVLVVGHTGHAGFGNRAGTVDITIEAIVTSGLPMGKALTDYENAFPGLLTFDTTDGAVIGAIGRRGVASGLFMNSLTYTFTQNGNITMAMGMVGDGVLWFPLTSPQGMDIDIEHTPATWDTVKLGSPIAGVIILSGVQTCTVSASMTRDLIYEVGTFLPIDKPSTHPHNVTVSLNSLANSVQLADWLNKFATDFNAGNQNNLVTLTVSAQGYLANREADAVDRRDVTWITASGLRPTQATLAQAVGANSTIDLSFTGSSLKF